MINASQFPPCQLFPSNYVAGEINLECETFAFIACEFKPMQCVCIVYLTTLNPENWTLS